MNSKEFTTGIPKITYFELGHDSLFTSDAPLACISLCQNKGHDPKQELVSGPYHKMSGSIRHRCDECKIEWYSTPRPRRDNRRFQPNFGSAPVYACASCHKRTRETGDGESSCGLCRKCYRHGGAENHHSDNGHDGPMEGCLVCEKDGLGKNI